MSDLGRNYNEPLAKRRHTRSSDAFTYSSQDADAYGSLEISGTTYEVGFEALAAMLGDLTGMVWLDFGAGAGRSSRFLRELGADFVFGVDHNLSMVRLAKLRNCSGIGYALMDQAIPIASASVDGAISCNVYIEIPSRVDMETVNSEIYRALKPGSWFFVMSANSPAIGYEFKNFMYPASIEGLSSGMRVPCVIKTREGVVELEDFYWTRDDYETSLRSAGFSVREALTPISSPGLFAGTSESFVAPFLILACFKE